MDLADMVDFSSTEDKKPEENDVKTGDNDNKPEEKPENEENNNDKSPKMEYSFGEEFNKMFVKDAK